MNNFTSFKTHFPQAVKEFSDCFIKTGKSCDIPVSVVIRLRVVRFESQREQRILVFSETLRLSLGAHPASCFVDTGRSFPWCKVDGRTDWETDHWPTCGAQFKSIRSHTSTWLPLPLPFYQNWTAQVAHTSMLKLANSSSSLHDLYVSAYSNYRWKKRTLKITRGLGEPSALTHYVTDRQRA